MNILDMPFNFDDLDLNAQYVAHTYQQSMIKIFKQIRVFQEGLSEIESELDLYLEVEKQLIDAINNFSIKNDTVISLKSFKDIKIDLERTRSVIEVIDLKRKNVVTALASLKRDLKDLNDKMASFIESERRGRIIHVNFNKNSNIIKFKAK